MKNVVLICLFAALILNEAVGQSSDSLKVRQRPLFQVGSFPYGMNGFVVHAGLERAFRRAPYLTHGPRIEYARIGSNNDNNVYAGFQLKFYPTYWADPVPYRGLYIGIEPLAVIAANKSNEIVRYGPALSSMLGYQYVFNNHNLSLGVEASLMHCYNMQEDSPSDAYQHGISVNSFLLLKVGFRL